MNELDLKKAFNLLVDHCNSDEAAHCKCILNNNGWCMIKDIPFVDKFDIKEGSEINE